MPPKFRPPVPKGPVVSAYDIKRDKATDPERLAYLLTEEACRVLCGIVRAGHPVRTLGYVARHLTEKGLVVRVAGRDAKYKATFRGEAVVEVLQRVQRFPHHFSTES